VTPSCAMKNLVTAAAIIAAQSVAAGASVTTELIRTTWGVSDFDDPLGWEAWMLEQKADGYSGFEAPTWIVCGVSTYSSFGLEHSCNETRVELFRHALNVSGMSYVAQVHTAGYPISSGALDDHVASLRSLVATSKLLGATLLNVHGGCDWWPLSTKRAFLSASDEIEKEEMVEIAHETHRMRALAFPADTGELLRDDGLNFHLTADLSHWVVALERVFDFPADSAWWPPLLELVAARTSLTHARVGSPREIQVADPSAPSEEALLLQYEAIWNTIWAKQLKLTGRVRVEAEFGPAPYMPVLPHTDMPIADLAAVVDYVGKRQIKRLANGECGWPGES